MVVQSWRAWGGMESDGLYDMCCVGCDVPMWVGIGGGYVVNKGHAMGIFNVGEP